MLNVDCIYLDSLIDRVLKGKINRSKYILKNTNGRTQTKYVDGAIIA